MTHCFRQPRAIDWVLYHRHTLVPLGKIEGRDADGVS